MPRHSDKTRPELRHYQVDGSALGKVLAARRKALDLSMQELSDRAGVSATTVLKLERGEITVQLDKFIQVMDQLGLPLASVITFEGEPTITTQNPLSLKVVEKLENDQLEEAAMLLVNVLVDRKRKG